MNEIRSGNNSNGFGKLIICSYQEKSEIIDSGHHLAENCHFAMKAPMKTS